MIKRQILNNHSIVAGSVFSVAFIVAFSVAFVIA